jgi:hypothetical protein
LVRSLRLLLEDDPWLTDAIVDWVSFNQFAASRAGYSIEPGVF